MADLLIRDVRIVPFRDRDELSRTYSTKAHTTRADAARLRATDAAHGVGAGDPVDVLIRGGRVVEVGTRLHHPGADRVDGGGAFAIPGLWDAHAHLDLEAARAGRLDLRATRSPEDVLALVRDAVAGLPAHERTRGTSVQGFGFRLSTWSRTPGVAELDAVSGDVPVALVSGDVHSGWLNSAALRALGVPDPGGPLREDPWFDTMNRLDEVPGSRELRERGYRSVISDMLARGVTGVVDMTQPATASDWSERVTGWAAASPTAGAGGATGMVLPRIRAAIYRAQLPGWVELGVRTGDPLPGSPIDEGGHALFTQGPLKVIADGSMGTCTAFTHDAYPSSLGLAHDHGVENMSREELTDLLAEATAAGFDMAVHAIGDACLEDVAAAFGATGARGRVEHAQLLGAPGGPGGDAALEVLIRGGIEVSVQPGHLLDDWAAVSRVWPGKESRCYAFADLVGAGIRLHLGSDAPVAPLDPWLALSVAVGRVVPGGDVWGPEQRLTPEEALAASVDGCGPVAVGSRGDMVLCAENPLAPAPDAAEAAARLRELRPLATVVAGGVAAG
ncbi:amidohydrolase [Actinomyces provencensis]|uniref:amidohydrolase n=1 Tax=Actinomyces provencensis TaxID=1720198 RepID=UPI00098EFE13|nr:amidohydrolase family protein [Actinomyces provencensis]